MEMFPTEDQTNNYGMENSAESGQKKRKNQDILIFLINKYESLNDHYVTITHQSSSKKKKKDILRSRFLKLIAVIKVITEFMEKYMLILKGN